MKTTILIFLSIAVITVASMLSNAGMGLWQHIIELAQGDLPTPTFSEVVLPPKSTVSAFTKEGSITIKAGNGLKRYYSWEGATRSVIMLPRNERWNGSMGLYYPGVGSHWIPKHNGISRGVLEEGQINFDNINAAMAWIEKCRQWTPLVYRNDGLLVAYGKNLPREQLNVGVWQILIKSQKPTTLPGSSATAISTTWDIKRDN